MKMLQDANGLPYDTFLVPGIPDEKCSNLWRQEEQEQARAGRREDKVCIYIKEML